MEKVYYKKDVYKKLTIEQLENLLITFSAILITAISKSKAQKGYKITSKQIRVAINHIGWAGDSYRVKSIYRDKTGKQI